MYIPYPPDDLSTRTLYSEKGPLKKGGFSLDTSGMASFFGGDAAVAAMTTLHLDPSRQWMGWYNCPGTYEVAKRYSMFCKSRLLEGLFPNVTTDLATLLGMANLKGAKYIGAHNGSILEEAGPFSAVLMKDCMDIPETVRVPGRVTQEVKVTVCELAHIPGVGQAVLGTPICSPFIAALPIAVSAIAAAVCGTFKDWVSFSMIVLGVLVNGISCIVIGSGKFTFHCAQTVNASGDGILVSEKEKEIVVLKGDENAVNPITRGSFTLDFKGKPKRAKGVKWCCILLVLQVILQLLLIPQGSLLGQLMFIASLASSWVYNLWLSSRDREKIQREVFVKGVLRSPKRRRFILGTRTSAVVFILLVLQPKDPAKTMDLLLPDTPGWKKFKAHIVSQIRDGRGFRSDDSWWGDPEIASERGVLETLCRDAEAAREGFREHYLSDLPTPASNNIAPPA